MIVCSYTKTAAKHIVQQGIAIPNDNSGTLHSMCYRILGYPKLTQNHMHDFNAFVPLFNLSLGSKKANVDDPFDDIGNETTEGDRLLQELTISRAKMIPYKSYSKDLKSFADKWDEWKKESQLLDFTDLIELCLNDVDEHPLKPWVGIADESQDFTLLQISLLRKWFSGKDQVLMLAGDPDQNLYTFAGTSSKSFLEPRIASRHITFLDQSYRVPIAIHKVADKLIKQNKYRFTEEYKPTDKEGAVNISNCSSKEPYEFMPQIKRHIDNGESTMILASCSYMLSNFITELKENGIPFCNPYRTRRRDWNQLVRGVKTKTILDRFLSFLCPDFSFPPMWNYKQLSMFVDVLQSKGVLINGAKTNLQNLANNKLAVHYLEDKLSEKIENKQADIFADAPDTFSNDVIQNYYNLLLDFFIPENASKLTNMIQSGNIDAEWFSKNALASKFRLLEYPLSVYHKSGLDALTSKPLVITGTIHSVKGGEADHVILLPDLSLAGYERYEDKDGRAEVIRMFYVGLTRAKDTVTITQPCNTQYADLI